MKKMDLRGWLRALAFCGLAALAVGLVSCTSMIKFSVPKLPRADMGGLRNIGFDVSGPLYMDYQFSAESDDPAASDKARAYTTQARLGKVVTRYPGLLQASLEKQLRDDNVFVPVHYVPYTQFTGDALILVTITSIRMDDTYKETKNATTLAVDRRWIRGMSLSYRYEVVRIADQRIVFSDEESLQASDETEGLDNFRRLRSDDSLLTQLLENAKSSILSSITPRMVPWNVWLIADSRNDRIKSGIDLAKQKNYVAAEKIFRDEWINNQNAAGGINAALLKFNLGDREGALALLSEVYAKTGDDRAKQYTARLEEIIADEKAMREIGYSYL